MLCLHCKADIMHGILDNVVSHSMDGDADLSLLTAHLMQLLFPMILKFRFILYTCWWITTESLSLKK